MRKSAGLLLYRVKNKIPEVFLVHPGGPFWSKKEIGAWSIPKGEIEEGEDHLQAAVREMEEETGIKINIPFEKLVPLTEAKQKSGKIIYAWASEADFEISDIKSNLFEMEWPPKSGKIQPFPEVDKGGWFTLQEAKIKIVPGQIPIIEEIEKKV